MKENSFITNAPNAQRFVYEEAIRRYAGPATIEIRDEAFQESGIPYPECFSVHITNDPGPVVKQDLELFWKMLYQVRKEE